MNILAQKPADSSYYLAFTPDTTLEAALTRFVQRFGCQPANWFSYNRQIWVGPCPDEREEPDNENV